MSDKRTGAAHNRGSSKQDYSTPLELIRAVESRFGPIAFDLAADMSNRVCADYYDEVDDSLSRLWHKLDGLLWLNPPFRRIEPWAKKCAMESGKGARIAFLVPAAVGSRWFADWVHARALVLPLRPRVSFDGEHPYPKDIILCMYGEPPGFEPWRWKGGHDGT